jgi:hypothetical protein
MSNHLYPCIVVYDDHHNFPVEYRVEHRDAMERLAKRYDFDIGLLTENGYATANGGLDSVYLEENLDD